MTRVNKMKTENDSRVHFSDIIGIFEKILRSEMVGYNLFII